MENIDFNFILPLIILGLSPVVLMIAISIHRSHLVTFLLTLVALVIYLFSIINLWSRATQTYSLTDQLLIDQFSLFYMLLLGLAGLVIAIISYPYLNQHVKIREEYYILFLSALLGASVLVCSVHFASLFLGLEILSISLYAMIAYTRERNGSIEGGLKYLILAAASSAFLLFGMGLIYIDIGALSFSGIGASLQSMTAISTAGIAMMLVGVGFKLALVPFHTWTPDIYQGAPAPVSALIASVSKGSMAVVLIRFIHSTSSHEVGWFFWTLALMAIASMLAGSLLALRQSNVKRLLAYSSIAHLGYLLIAVIASSQVSLEAVTYYLVAYFISIIGAFGTLSIFSIDSEIEEIEELRGMFWTRPVLSAVFSIMFFSLVGIPLTAGFIGKFYVVLAAVDNGLWLLVITLVVSSAIGLYYYLRVIKTMLSPVDDNVPKTATGQLSKMGIAVISLLAILVIWLGVFPSDLITIIKVISAGF